jgi:hypothetical protein
LYKIAARFVTTQVQSSKVHGSEINLSTVNREPEQLQKRKVANREP